MTGMIASINWSASPNKAGGPISPGVGITSTVAGTFVPATAANIAASPSQKCEGVAVTPSDGTTPFQVQTSGRLAPGLVPGVGPGNTTDFAIINSSGLVVRSSAFVTGLTIGICAADGSVDLGLGAVQNTAVPVRSAVTSSSLVAGDSVTGANDPANPLNVTLATPGALGASGQVISISKGTYSPGQTAQLYGVNDVVPAAVSGLGPGLACAVVAGPTGHPVRKVVPDPTDAIVGICDQQGSYTVLPSRPMAMAVNSGSSPFTPDPTGTVPSADALQAAIDAGVLLQTQQNLGLAASSYFVDIPRGIYVLDHPLELYCSRIGLRGSGRGTTLLLANQYAGPAIFLAPHRTPPRLALNDFAGGHAMILDHDPVNLFDKWLTLSEYGSGMNVNGFAQLEIACIFRKTQNVNSDVEHIIASQGSRKSTDTPAVQVGDTNVSTGFAVGVGNQLSIANNGVYFTLTTTAGNVTIFTAANTLTVDGKYHEIICNYDGTAMRIFVDKVLVASGAQTGTVLQRSWERTSVGHGATFYFGQGLLTAAANGNLASLNIRDAVTITSSGTLTLPTTKYQYPPSSPHCSFAMNFEDYWPPLATIPISNVTNTNPMVITTSVPHGLTSNTAITIQDVGGAVGANNNWPLGLVTVLSPTTLSINVAAGGAYTGGGEIIVGGHFTLAYTRTNYGSSGAATKAFFPAKKDTDLRIICERCIVEKMTINSSYGDAILSYASPYSTVREIYTQSRGGIVLWENCYNWLIEDVSLFPNGALADRKVGIQFGAACYMSVVRRADVVGYEFGILVMSDVTIESGIYFIVNRHQLVVMKTISFSMLGMNIFSDESGTAGVGEDSIMLIGVNQAFIEGAQISIALTNNHCVAIDQVGGRGMVNHMFANCLFICSPTAPGHIIATSGRSTPLAGNIILDQPAFEPNPQPIIDPASSAGPTATCPIIVRPWDYMQEGIFTVPFPSDANFSLTRDQHLHGQIKFTGTLTAGRTVTVPAFTLGPKWYLNATTGGFAVTLVAAGGSTTISLAPGTGHLVGFADANLYQIA